MTYGAVRRLNKAALVLCLAAPAALAEPVTVLAFGDSLTQGYGLPPEDGFVPQMQEALEARGLDVTLINGGVSGDTTAGGLARIDWSLSEDVDALIVALGGNDMLRGFDPALTKSNLAGIVAAAGERPVMLVGLSAPGNYGPEYKAAFDAIFPDLAEATGALYFESFFKGIGQDPGDVGRFMQADGIHPNAAGVTRIVGAMAPAVADLVARVR